MPVAGPQIHESAFLQNLWSKKIFEICSRKKIKEKVNHFRVIVVFDGEAHFIERINL